LQATSRVSSMYNHLGIHHSLKKQKGSSKMTGPWAGSMIFLHEGGGVRILVTQDKWDEMKRLLEALVVLDESEWLDFKSLESVRGFLIFVYRTYRPVIPFLLGIHHMLDSWRPNQGEDGWCQN
jgi:hypothetical protein